MEPMRCGQLLQKSSRKSLQYFLEESLQYLSQACIVIKHTQKRLTAMAKSRTKRFLLAVPTEDRLALVDMVIELKRAQLLQTYLVPNGTVYAPIELDAEFNKVLQRARDVA